MTIQLSRSEVKRRYKQVEQLVVELCSLPSAVVKRLPEEDRIKEMINEAAGLKGGARKRHIKYIAKLLRESPVSELYDFMEKYRGSKLKKNKQYHEVEYFRDILIDEALSYLEDCRHYNEEMEENWPSESVETVLNSYPDIDKITLLRLARLFAVTHNKLHSRELFRVLRAAAERKEHSVSK